MSNLLTTEHENCLICGESNPLSFGLKFKPMDDDTVEAVFTGNLTLQGYDNILHGGVIASLLDSAMTHCLFNQGIKALTGDLRVRYHKSILCKATLTVRATLVENHSSLYKMRAEILEGGVKMATATAKFMMC